MQTHQTWQDSTRHGQRDIGGLVAHAQRKHRQQLAMSHCCTTMKRIHKLDVNSTDCSIAFVHFHQNLAMSCFHCHDVIELAQVSFLIIKHFLNTTTKLNKNTHTCLMASFPQPLLLLLQFYGPLSRTIQVSWDQKKHSLGKLCGANICKDSIYHPKNSATTFAYQTPDNFGSQNTKLTDTQ